MQRQERLSRLKISLVEGIGPRNFLHILEIFESGENFIEDCPKPGLKNLNKSLFDKWRRKCDEIDISNFLSQLKKYGIKYLVFGDLEYPHRLRHIHNPPIVLYYKGFLNNVDFANCISVVGTRRSSDYGELVTERLVGGLVDYGICVVSGLAYGIDRISHKVALERKGQTVAVLASSVEKPTPLGNKAIYDQILESGVVLSEHPPGTDCFPGAFPQRNRIVAGLSMGTLVVEAPKKSGALISASIAFHENREVFAVPSGIDQDRSEGANNLIKNQKAKLITCVEDILEEFPSINFVKKKSSQRFLNLTKRTGEIIRCIEKGPISEESLYEKFDIHTKDLLASLTELELKQLIEKRANGVYYVISK